MSKPKRIQRRRSKGWRMPANTVYVGRPTKWGNRYRVNTDRQRAVDLFEEDIRLYGGYRNNDSTPPIDIATMRRELQGKNLACWCPLDQPCHADVLLEIANS